MRSALLIANPKAHSVSASGRRDAVAVLATRFDVDVVETKDRGHAAELAKDGALGGVALIVVLGGDGTLNEVVNGLKEAPPAESLVAALPGGGANVFARSVGLPRDVGKAARIVAARAQHPRRIPLGRIDDRWFVTNCGMGFDAAIVREVEARPALKRRIGDLLFVLSGLRLFFGPFDKKTAPISMSWGEDGRNRRDRLFTVIVQNAPPFTFLGPRALRICPDVTLAGGLDAFAVDDFAASTVLPIIMRAFAKGGHVRNRHVTYLHDERALELRASRPTPTQVDGEFIGERQSATISLVPDALSAVF